MIDASSLAGQTVTAIVSVGGAGPQPAQVAVISFAREGEPPFRSVLVTLEAGERLATLLKTHIENKAKVVLDSLRAAQSDGGRRKGVHG